MKNLTLLSLGYFRDLVLAGARTGTALGCRQCKLTAAGNRSKVQCTSDVERPAPHTLGCVGAPSHIDLPERTYVLNYVLKPKSQP